MNAESTTIFEESCAAAAKKIKQRMKNRRGADKYYLRHRETVLEKHRICTAPVTPVCCADPATLSTDYTISFK